MLPHRAKTLDEVAWAFVLSNVPVQGCPWGELGGDRGGHGHRRLFVRCLIMCAGTVAGQFEFVFLLVGLAVFFYFLELFLGAIMIFNFNLGDFWPILLTLAGVLIFDERGVLLVGIEVEPVILTFQHHFLSMAPNLCQTPGFNKFLNFRPVSPKFFIAFDKPLALRASPSAIQIFSSFIDILLLTHYRL